MPEEPGPDERPDRTGMWSAIQAAVLAGWGATFRLILILAVVTAAITPLYPAVAAAASSIVELVR